MMREDFGKMQTNKPEYRALTLLMDLNWDRALYASAITVSLGMAGFLQTVLV